MLFCGGSGGLKEYVEWVNRGKDAMHPVLTFSRTVDGVEVRLSINVLGSREGSNKHYAWHMYVCLQAEVLGCATYSALLPA